MFLDFFLKFQRKLHQPRQTKIWTTAPETWPALNVQAPAPLPELAPGVKRRGRPRGSLDREPRKPRGSAAPPRLGGPRKPSASWGCVPLAGEAQRRKRAAQQHKGKGPGEPKKAKVVEEPDDEIAGRDDISANSAEDEEGSTTSSKSSETSSESSMSTHSSTTSSSDTSDEDGDARQESDPDFI